MTLNYFVDDTVYNDRLSICKKCEHYGTLGMCNECKCIMPVKAKFAQFYCPLKVWDRDYTKLTVIKSN